MRVLRSSSEASEAPSEDSQELLPLRFMLGRRQGLPLSVSNFIGRKQEASAIAKLLASRRLITLTGPPGAGKSRLALEVATDLSPRYPGGVWLADLASISHPDLVPQAVASALSLPEEKGSLAHAIGGAFPRQSVLVVLDNCERVIDAVAELTEHLLVACPNLSVLATSREPLSVQGESVWRVPPLTVPAPDAEFDEIASKDSVLLFEDRAQAIQTGFCLNSDNACDVADICRRLDGLPLAIEMAAARLEMLSPAEIALLLEDPFNLLTKGSRTAAARHTSLQAAMDSSYELLTSPEQALFRRLSVFSEGCTLDAATEVCFEDGAEPQGVLNLMQSLVAKSLVSLQPGKGKSRYLMLGTVRRYAGGTLAASGEQPEVEAEHAHWYFRMAENLRTLGSGQNQKSWVQELEVERYNCRLALRWALRQGEIDLGLRLARALAPFWRLRGCLVEGRQWLEEFLSKTDGTFSPERVEAQLGAGVLAAMACDFDAARSYSQQVLDSLPENAFKNLRGRALGVLGWALLYQQGPPAAVAVLEQSVAIVAESEETTGLADSITLLGHAQMFGARTPAAIDLFEQGVEAARQVRDDRALAAGLMGLGWAHLSRGDHRTSEKLLTEAQRISRDLGARFELAEALSFLAEMHRTQGDILTARAHSEECGRIARAVGAPGLVARSYAGLARLAQSEGDFPGAVSLFKEAINAARRANHWFVLSRCLLNITQVFHQTGRSEEAVPLLTEARAVARDKHDRDTEAMIIYVLARRAQSQGEYERALALHHQALEIRKQLGQVNYVQASLRALSALQAHTRPEAAARLLGAAGSLARDDSPPVVLPTGCPCCETDEQLVQTIVEPGKLDAGKAQGAAMSEDEALAYASRGRGKRGRPRAGWESLTPTELDVVKLVKEGLSNPEIGERLFISRRTVGAHLSHIFSKLGIASRKELRQIGPES